MMNRKVMQRLVWKDARTLSPLLIAVLIAIVIFNVLLAFYFSVSDLSYARERLQLSRMVWILLPNLLAFGAPAMLIGGEEESGSLAWLRTLPASWLDVSISKLVVAFAALVVLWAVSSSLYWVQWAISSDYVVASAESAGYAPDWSVLAVLTQLWFSTTLLLTSLCMGYFFRSPINALLAVLPAMIVLTIAFVSMEEQLFESQNGNARWKTIPAFQLWSIYALAVTGVLLVMTLCHQWIARRRLSGPEENLKQRIEQSVSSDAFRPPSSPATWYGVSLIHRRPSQTRALLWQATRQNFASLVLLTIIASAGVMFAVLSPRHYAELGGLISGAACFVIVGMTFYGDSVRRRSVFLSDRGISNTLIWRTRLIPTAASFAIIIAALLLSAQFTRGRFEVLFLFLTILVVGYCLGQLVSQWAPRPVFSFLAGPVFGMLAIFVFIPLFDFYREGALLAAWVTVPILLFASWRLTPRWVSGIKDRGYALRFAGYLSVAAVLPYAMILSIRAATIPADETSWRTRTLAFEFPKPSDEHSDVEILVRSDVDVSILYSHWSLEKYLETPPRSNFEERFDREMQARTSVGANVSMQEVVARMPSWPYGINETRMNPDVGRLRLRHRESELDMARLLLKWSGMIRTQSKYGDANWTQLTRIAEMGEHIATVVLEDRLDESGVTPEILEVIRLYPSDELVRESRRNSLIAAWQDYRRRRENNPWSAFFPLTKVKRPMLMPFLEDLRRDRFVDQTVRIADQNWRPGGATNNAIPSFVYSAREAGMLSSIDAILRNRKSEKIETLKRRVQ